MASWIKSTIQYSISLAVGGILLWYVYKDTDFNALYEDIQEADLSWVFVSFAASLLSHFIRAYRWNLLMEPVGLTPPLRNSFLAVMTGYLANIILPRMGEVSRCAILQKTDRIKLNTSFGTVVTERLFDLLTLLTIIFITLIIEFDRLSGFVFNLLSNRIENSGVTSNMVYIGIGSVVLGIILTFILFKVVVKLFGHTSLFLKAKVFIRGLVEGLLSFRKLRKKKEFILSTIGIWVCYYLMSYVMFFSLESTSDLGIVAGLAVLVLGGLGMAAPVQGGIGAFHWIIQNGLVLYGLTETEGLLYATIVHSSQMILIIAVGLISLVTALLFFQSKNSEPQGEPLHENIRENF